ncbi:hypothetical protein D3C77_96700 [compost metagenome]
MKRIEDSKQPKKPSTFDRYFTQRSAYTEKLILKALGTIDASRYRHFTEYCKTLSAIISELRAVSASDPATPLFNKEVRAFSYVTLMRNTNYRKIVLARFESAQEIKALAPDEDTDDMKLQIASLIAQTNLLKYKIISMDSGRNIDSLDTDAAYAVLDKANTRIGLLLRVYEKTREASRGIFKIINEPSPNHPTIGLYSYTGLIATQDEIDEISRAAKEHPLRL